ncbi:conserved exported protein of unknown function [Rhodovastum atsumiense]|uniref:Uncharacterized protein n=1 Tax=Rhodovastum atsumiense TaxID=504468 RepID=A0A5M6ISN2_9PROT|nr:hypothetical protein [Rhodovastum atsumiense]KAA5611211.1 hypothetical protein F1189_15700 [Rhodovastum atsumiense]CAH2602479.1 conserved exported protein of unknown function [Rhodovastum atsumiense]
MHARHATALMLGLAGAVIMLAGDRDGPDLPLGQVGLPGGRHVTMSLGSVGLDPHSGASYVPPKGESPYYFPIPAEQPARKSPGILLRIPFGTGGSR